MKPFLRNSLPVRLALLLRDYLRWRQRQFAAPSPHLIKQACLLRNSTPNATWIETGTFLGETTELLARHGAKVVSIEPEPTLFANARQYFTRFANVEIVNGLSEDVFPTLLPGISGNVNFWLDGHYSAGITHKGPQDTPVLDELRSIADNLPHFEKVCVLVDDIRCFQPHRAEYASYPALDLLVDWARSNKLHWHIEHDIFIARNFAD